jgi:hypothetical protein
MLVALAFPRTPRRLARAALDVAVVLWAVAWLVVCLLVAREVDGLTDPSRNLPLDRVRALNGDPRNLADAELERLGLSRGRRPA